LELRDGDIIVVTCKLVSKCLGLLVNINDVKPLPRALVISSKAGIDPWFIELLLRERDELLVAISVKELADKGIINIYGLSKKPETAKKALEEYPTMFLALRDGMLWSDVGVDSSNYPQNVLSIPSKEHRCNS